MELVRLAGPEPPPEMAELRAQADREGYRALARIVREWASFGPEDASGTLLGLRSDGLLVAVGGITPDPGDPGLRRMRRFYVHPDHRLLGHGRSLAQAILATTDAPVVVRAPDARAAAFWERLGFEPDPGLGRTHRLPLRRI
jgi:GNAT superfamily N-acetyltransferase